VLRSTKTQAVKDSAVSAAELASSLAKDKKFRKQLLSAISHGTLAKRRASKRIGFVAAVTRLGADEKLKNELRKMTKSLENAWGRVEKKRSHKLRNSLLIVGGVGGAAVAAMKARNGGLPNVGIVGGGTSPRAIDESIEVNVPVSAAYNQWTQFEDFPLFMEGVDHVHQKDDTRLHWVATVAGKTNEWDAKILEQHPDKQISWISEDGKKTRGTVTFEPVEDSDPSVDELSGRRPEGSAGLSRRPRPASSARRSGSVQGTDREPRRREWRLARRGFGGDD